MRQDLKIYAQLYRGLEIINANPCRIMPSGLVNIINKDFEKLEDFWNLKTNYLINKN